ncbi:hypothetical protein BH20ACT23_BH20ACT23_14210 [soil metagenome]
MIDFELPDEIADVHALGRRGLAIATGIRP